jgi:potassium efflux system protein
LFLTLFIGWPVGYGDELADSQAVMTEQSLTVELVQRAITDLENRKDIDVEKRIQAIDNYRSALNNLNSAAENEACQKALVCETETVSSRVEQLKQQRAELKDQKPTVESGLNLSEMEQLLPQWELLLAAHKKARQAAESESQTRSQRRKEIRTLMVAKEQRIADATAQLQTLAGAETSTQSNSLAARLLTRRLTLVKELPALQAELAKYDAEESADFLRLRIDVANALAAHREACIELLQQRINAAREQAAEHSIQQARVEAIAAAPSLKHYAEQNQELAEKTKAIAEALAQAQADKKLAGEMYESLVRQFNLTQKKVDSVGLTSSVGALLRKQKKNLPDVSARRAAVALRQPLINDTQYETFEHEDQRQEMSDAKTLIAEIAKTSDASLELPFNNTLNMALLESAAEDLIARRAETLDILIRSNGQYFDELIDLDATDQQLIKLAAQYENYIDERVLWIRSGRPITADFTLDASDTWLISPAKWLEISRTMMTDVRERFYLYILVLLPWSLLVVRGSLIRRRIRNFGEIAARANCRSIVPTLRTAVLTTIVAGVWPALLLLMAWRLNRVAGDLEFARSLSYGLQCLASLWFAVDLLRQTCRPMGLGEAHFRWSSHATESLRTGLRSMSYVAFPLTLVTATLSVGEQSHGRDALERVLFVVGMCVAAFGVFRLLTPGGVLREYYNNRESQWSDRLKQVWWIAGACVPLSLASLAMAGYYYTAEVLAWRLFATCGFVIALLVVRSLFFRMLLLRRRTLSMEQSRQRAAATTAIETASPLVAGMLPDDPKVDISTHSLQSRRLINSAMIACSMVGLWMIWVQVLPALSMLDKYPVWTIATASTGDSAAKIASPAGALASVASTSGDTAPLAVVDQRNDAVITISDIALALLITAVTFVLFRNGPGLLEISVLQQLPVDASVRYAITTLVSYAIVLIGTIAACSTIGLKWSQIQWLATALTFGLAFGLQEIFANFVAGLIILIERPIRVGDIVTVDDVSGVVSRIRIRATSITNWDRKEYVVPNKEFITGRLLNWTLSDKINRIVINVGIAYGSDTERARQILLEAANSHPLVLQDPPSVATFEGFGDSALNMVLRAYLPTLDNRLEVIHQLHTSINIAFRAEGIEIPFPQRDLHVRTTAGALGLAISPIQDQRTFDRDVSQEAA